MAQTHNIKTLEEAALKAAELMAKNPNLSDTSIFLRAVPKKLRVSIRKSELFNMATAMKSQFEGALPDGLIRDQNGLIVGANIPNDRLQPLGCKHGYGVAPYGNDA